MKKTNKSELCPLCGGKKKPAVTISRANKRAVKGIITVNDPCWAQSIDDKTASDFAEVMLNGRKLQG